MNVTINTSADFDRNFHKLRKHYKSLVKDFQRFIEQLQEQSITGKEVIAGVFKYRMAISSKGKGKSGGARIISCEVILCSSVKEITLLSIYDKSEKSSISESEIKDLQKRAGL